MNIEYRKIGSWHYEVYFTDESCSEVINLGVLDNVALKALREKAVDHLDIIDWMINNTEQ